MSNDPTTVQVQLSERSYAIAIGADQLDRLGSFVSDRVPLAHAVVITDTNVQDLYADGAVPSLERAGGRVDLLIIEAGEASKSITAADQLWQKMLDCGTDRKSVVIALGGGVVGDLAGFVAATFARGLSFFQVPTTLLAQVDSSVGGKVGVNLPAAKNMVGAFWQPRGVLIDIGALQTLPDREYRAGLAEVVKYGVILDKGFFGYLFKHREAINQRDPRILQFIVARCCRLKANVVEADEREESGSRAILNYGHTFCHAIEAVTGYGQYLHGEAVAIGMLCASRLSARLGRTPEELTNWQQDLLEAFGLPISVPDVPADQLLAAMRRDKKVEGGQLRFVLPREIGQVELVDGVSDQDVLAAMA